MSELLEVGDISVEEGEKKEGWINGVELTTTDSIDIPVIGINGNEDGPTLMFFAVQHGVEIQNTGVVHKLTQDHISPDELAGQIIGLPVANPIGFMHGTYRSWIDGEDLDQVTVEDPNGGTTARLANAIWEEAWSQSDMVINMHANTRDDSLPYQSFNVSEKTEKTQERMARAMGLTTIRYENPWGSTYVQDTEEDPNVPPTLRNNGIEEGIAELEIELIDSRWISEPSQSMGVEGLLNLVREFDMLPGESRQGHELQTEIGADIIRCEYTGGSGYNRFGGMLRVDKGGFFYPKKDPGEFISEGEVVAEIVDMHGNVVEEVTMPEEGYIWAYPGGQFFDTSGLIQAIQSGGYVAFMFTHEEE